MRYQVTIGSSVLLLAVGAILKWAVTAHVSWIDLQTAGTVLFVVGILALLLSVAYAFRGTGAGGGTRAPVRRDEQETRSY
jgi:hypothetical protein